MHDAEPVVLPEALHQRLLSSRILPLSTAAAVAQERPVTVFVAGQPGAGKTTLADLIHAVMDRRGGAVRISRDLYKEAHQHYPRLLEEDVRTAGARVRPDTVRWQSAVEAHVRSLGCDAVVETALADPGEFREAALAHRQAGARIEVLALATPEAVSQAGVLVRFLTEAADGGGRYVSWANHDACAQGMLRTLAAIEAEQLADRITVITRDGAVLYTNDRPAKGPWNLPAGAPAAVKSGRERPWSAQETHLFRRSLDRAAQLLHRELLPADKRLAVQRDSERAAALAEPVRRLAQPLAAPPGVAYHRLSHEEHRWMFEEMIVPQYLARTVKRPDPRAVYVLGQPGAGKTEAAAMVRRGMRPGAAHLVGDRLKQEHPDYERLLKENPREAGAAIREDYRAWMRQAEEWVRRLPGDAVIEAAPGSAESLFASAEPFGRDGYPIELVVLGVREADSRQGTMLRYAHALKLGVPARLTTRSGHDRCFDAVTDVVDHAAEHPAVTAVTIVRRDGSALLREELPLASPRAGWALRAERSRPYTGDEARRFLALHRGLRSALPQHQAELQEIAALARPLLPARIQARLTVPDPVPWPLPLPQPGAGYSPLSWLSSAA